jgi:hypothetical protein
MTIEMGFQFVDIFTNFLAIFPETSDLDVPKGLEGPFIPLFSAVSFCRRKLSLVRIIKSHMIKSVIKKVMNRVEGQSAIVPIANVVVRNVWDLVSSFGRELALWQSDDGS